MHVHRTLCRVNPTKLRRDVRRGRFVVSEYTYFNIVVPNRLHENVNIITIEEIGIVISNN
jgi:hypothetical protein